MQQGDVCGSVASHLLGSLRAQPFQCVALSPYFLWVGDGSASVGRAAVAGLVAIAEQLRSVQGLRKGVSALRQDTGGDRQGLGKVHQKRSSACSSRDRKNTRPLRRRVTGVTVSGFWGSRIQSIVRP